MTITLTDAQFSTLVNALHIAANKFEENAKYFRMGRPVSPSFQEIARQFDCQAKDAWELSYVFNGAESVAITVAGDETEVHHAQS